MMAEAKTAKTNDRCQKKIDAAVAATKEADAKVLAAAVDGLNATIAEQKAQIEELKAQLDQPSQRFPGDPGDGKLLYGLNVTGQDPTARERFFGAPVQSYRSYWQPTQTDQLIACCKRDNAAGRLPFVSTKVPNGNWADVAAGKQNAWLDDLLTKLGALDFAVWLCLHHEPWDDNPSGGESYKAMYRYVYSKKPANVALVPILQSYPFDPKALPPQSGNLLDWYDPDACDIVGLDQYNHKSFNPDNRKAWRSTEDCLTIVDIAQRVLPGKPVAIAEWGVRTNPATKGAAAGWMQDFYQGALRRGVVGLSFFDSGLNVNDGGSPWTLDDTSDGTDGTERMNAFKAVLTSEEER